MQVEYRGYGNSSRVSPRLSTLLTDVEPFVTGEALQTIRELVELPEDLPLFAIGRSLGGHPAIHVCALALAISQPRWAIGLILESATASVRHWERLSEDAQGSEAAVGEAIGRPPAPCGVHPVGVLENLGKASGLGRVHLPILLLHGEEDDVVPPFQQQLFEERIGPTARLVCFAGCGHNNLPSSQKYAAELRRFVDETLAAAATERAALEGECNCRRYQY